MHMIQTLIAFTLHWCGVHVQYIYSRMEHTNESIMKMTYQRVCINMQY